MTCDDTRVGSIVGEKPLVRVADRMTLDARNAAAEAIAAYLMGATFFRAAGNDPLVTNTPFQLRNVRREWPEATEALEYPCASIIDYGMPHVDASSLTPVVLEETWGKYGEGTVARKIGEMTGEFQVDYFCNDKPTREAIAAQLSSIFSPAETFGVTLRCSRLYFGTTVRARFHDQSFEDSAETAQVREWRLRTTMSFQIGVLDLVSLPNARFAGVVQDCD